MNYNPWTHVCQKHMQRSHPTIQAQPSTKPHPFPQAPAPPPTERLKCAGTIAMHRAAAAAPSTAAPEGIGPASRPARASKVKSPVKKLVAAPNLRDVVSRHATRDEREERHIAGFRNPVTHGER